MNTLTKSIIAAAAAAFAYVYTNRYLDNLIDEGFNF